MVKVEDFRPINMEFHVQQLVDFCHGAAVKGGWHPVLPPTTEGVVVKLALIHSEISEALEGIRKNIDDGHLPHRKAFEVELADALIRIFDLAGATGVDVAGALVEKMAYNAKRADHKPENRAKENGKKF